MIGTDKIHAKYEQTDGLAYACGRISFNNVELPHSALLDKFCSVDQTTGSYLQRGEERMRIEVIGQRLLTGRMCIAQAALVAARTLFASALKYADSKPVWSPTGSPKLAEMPQVRCGEGGRGGETLACAT